MPAQIFVTHDQLVSMADTGHGIIICEGPFQPGANTLEAWVMDDPTLSSNSHRSIVIEPDGSVIGDEQIGDNQ